MLSVTQLLSKQVRARPDKTAVIVAGDRITYSELNRRIDVLSRVLQDHGVRRGDVVGLWLDRSVTFVAAIFACFRVGAAYLPLDVRYPRGRIDSILLDAVPRLVICNGGEHGPRLDKELPVHEIDWNAQGARRSPLALRPEDAAYVIYTSGSTGQPKGVVVEHRGLVNLARVQSHVFGIRAGTRVLQYASPGFDAAVSEILTTLLQGGTLVVASQEHVLPGPRLVELLTDEAVEVATLPPAVLRVLDHTQLSALRTLVAAGDVCDRALVQRWAPGRLFINAYGPTEATVCATMGACDARDLEAPTIGRPIDGVALEILDSNARPVPPGEVGEIAIGGIGVARGYLNNEESTALQFKHLPRCGGIFQRFYLTGDLGRILPDGRIEFLGRRDRQVKIRGQRVELDEVEKALGSLPSVRAAAVDFRTGDQGEGTLIAWVSPQRGFEGDAVAIRRALRHNLPTFMVPAEIVVVADLPLNAHGKVDRTLLIRDEPDAPSVRSNGVARDSIELRILAIWRAILGRSNLGVHDDWFDVGGDSLGAAALLNEVQTAFGVDINYPLLLERPSVATMADWLRSGASRNSSTAVRLTGAKCSAPPFYCVHPLIGSVMRYAELARLVGDVVSFYGLEARGHEFDIEPLRTVEAMAEYHLGVVREIHSGGPFLLGGWSFGGLVAYEMAKRLVSQKMPVGPLVLIDTWTPAAMATAPELGTQGENARFFARLRGGANDAEAIAVIVNVLGIRVAPDSLAEANTPDGWRRLWADALRVSPLAAALGENRVKRAIRVMLANVEAGRAYAPGHYGGPVILFEATADAGPIDSRARGWLDVCDGSVRRVPVPGSHRTMVSHPHVSELAHALKRVLGEWRNGTLPYPAGDTP